MALITGAVDLDTIARKAQAVADLNRRRREAIAEEVDAARRLFRAFVAMPAGRRALELEGWTPKPWVHENEEDRR